MIFNGGKNRLNGNFDFNDFYIYIENYYEQRVQQLSNEYKNQSDSIKNVKLSPFNINDQIIVYDDSIFYTIISNLFRILMSDLFISHDALNIKNLNQRSLNHHFMPIRAKNEVI
jgi:hypothetical protein